MTALGVHNVDAMIHLFGEIDKVFASSLRRAVAYDAEDTTSVMFSMKSGMSASMVRGEARKHLDIKRIAEIKKATGVPLTLHGGSGTDDEDFRKAIAAGINIVHINTELRVAWRASLAKTPGEVVPYKILHPVIEAVKEVVLSRLRLFNGVGLAAAAK